MIIKSKSLNLAFKTCFSVHNNDLNYFGHVENSKWILCSRKTEVRCGYFRFLMLEIR